MSNKKQPLITVITVTYNVADTIEHTLRSILSQTSDNYEYIVIDGNSTDGTKEILEKYKDKLAYYISKPDKGIYDALNKGIAEAKGQWIQSVHGDDYLISPTIYEELTPLLSESDADVIYGIAELKYPWGAIYKMGQDPIDSIWKKQPMNHQASFIKADILKRNPFDLKYRLAGDYNLFYSLYNMGLVFKQVDISITGGHFGGRSDKQRISSLNEVLEIKKKYDKNPWHILLHRTKILKTQINNVIKKLLPEKIVQKIISAKNK